MPVLSKGIVLDCFYLLIFYFEKFSTDVCRLPCAVNVNLNLSIFVCILLLKYHIHLIRRGILSTPACDVKINMTLASSKLQDSSAIVSLGCFIFATLGPVTD